MAAARLEHVRELTHVPNRTLPFASVQRILQPCSQFAAVSRVSFSTLGGVYFSVLGIELVGGRKYGFFQKELPYPDTEPVSLLAKSSILEPLRPLPRCLLFAIQEALGPNVLQASLEKLAMTEECIEGVDVRMDRLRKCRIGCMVVWWVFEESLSPHSVKFGGPLGVCGSRGRRGGHCYAERPNYRLSRENVLSVL